MQCQILYSGKNKKNITNLSSAELAKRVVNVKVLSKLAVDDILLLIFFFSEKNKTWAFHVNCLPGR